MATFTFDGQLFDLTENADGSARSLAAQQATLVVTTSEDIGFFSYRITGTEAELPDIEILNDNITSATVNGIQVLDANDVDSTLGTITVNGAETLTIAVSRETGVNRSDLALFALDGADLPTINSAGDFNSVLSSADFGRGSGPFAPNQRIEFSDLDQGAFEAGEAEPIAPVATGTSGPDVIEGGDGADNIDAGGGADSIDGGAGNDTISGGGGGDTLAGGGGSDELLGGGGKDVISGGGGKDTIEGGGGKDDLKGGGGKDVITGGGGKDTLDGGGGSDDLDGGGGKDVLIGGGGGDTLTGGRGKDDLTGGRGNDRFEFNRGDGRDTVTDYEDGRDKFIIGVGADAFGDLTITQAGADARIAFANVRITVEDTNADQLAANDFLF